MVEQYSLGSNITEIGSDEKLAIRYATDGIGPYIGIKNIKTNQPLAYFRGTAY